MKSAVDIYVYTMIMTILLPLYKDGTNGDEQKLKKKEMNLFNYYY